MISIQKLADVTLLPIVLLSHMYDIRLSKLQDGISPVIWQRPRAV